MVRSLWLRLFHLNLSLGGPVVEDESVVRGQTW